MSKSNNLTDFLTDVANSIRTRKSYPSTQKINPQNFSSEITSIPTGDNIQTVLELGPDDSYTETFEVGNFSGESRPHTVLIIPLFNHDYTDQYGNDAVTINVYINGNKVYSDQFENFLLYYNTTYHNSNEFQDIYLIVNAIFANRYVETYNDLDTTVKVELIVGDISQYTLQLLIIKSEQEEI